MAKPLTIAMMQERLRKKTEELTKIIDAQKLENARLRQTIYRHCQDLLAAAMDSSTEKLVRRGNDVFSD